MSSKHDFRQKLAEEFIKSLQAKNLEWKQDWITLRDSPANATTSKKYKGINRMWLMHKMKINNYEDNRWCTFKQIIDNNWHLEKGSKGEKIEYWLPYDKEAKKYLTWAEYQHKKDKSTIIFTVKYYTVFNGSQINGIPEKIKTTKNENITVEDLIKTIEKNMGVEIVNGDTNAYYVKREDKIYMPSHELFLSTYGYNSTVLHELGHATGHESRLNRNLGGGFGTEAYAFEELIAEITSCFTGEHLKIQADSKHIDNHKAYVQSWIELLQNKPESLIRAIKEAEKAANYLEFKAELINEKEYLSTVSSNMEVEEFKIISVEEKTKSDDFNENNFVKKKTKTKTL